MNGLLEMFVVTYKYIVVPHIFQCDRGPKGIDKLGVNQLECHWKGMQPYAEHTADKAGNSHPFGPSRRI